MNNFHIATAQYPSPFKEDIVSHWRQDINKIYDAWVRLYTDHRFFKYVWAGLKESHSQEELKRWDFFHTAYRYFVNSLCLEIRKACDADKDSISLISILRSMYVHNDFFTIERGLESIGVEKDTGFWREEYLKVWTKFSGAEQADIISQKLILGRIEALLEVTLPVRSYVNKQLAHSGRKDPPKVIYKQLWASANAIRELLRELNSLLNFKIMMMEAVAQYDRFGHLSKTWWQSDYNPPIGKGPEIFDGLED